MAISVLQENGNVDISGTLTSLAVTLTLTANSALHVLGWCGANSVGMSISDGVNTYPGGELDPLQPGTPRTSQFIANTVVGGSTTITLSTGIAGNLGLWVREIGGTSGSDAGKHNSLNTASTVTTANATTGTAVTPSAAPGLISSYACWLQGASNFGAQWTVGTAFVSGSTSILAIPTAIAASESLRYTSTAAQQALWTEQNAGQNVGVWTVLFIESSSGVPIAWVT
jgi:hypothetical protein